MKIAVLGAGFQGSACVYDLLQNPDLSAIGLADSDVSRLEKAVQKLPSDPRLNAHKLNVTDHQALVNFLKPYDVVASAVPYFLNLAITQAAIEAGTHMVDMGGNTDLVFEQRKLQEQAVTQGVTILPDCGLAPGLANILAAHGIEQLDQVDSVQIRVGGLPQFPKPPLNYQLFFSMHGLINEYVGQAVVLRNGQITEVETLSEVETLEFPEPIGACEAFVTLGGLSTLPWTYQGKVQTMDYKTIRYPGHCHQIRTMYELGLFDTTPVLVNQQPISPRDAFAAVVTPRLLSGDMRDVVLVKVSIEGTLSGEPVRQTYEITDQYDSNTDLTAMMRTTAFPVSIVAQMLANGSISKKGVQSLETTVPTALFIEELGKRRIQVHQKQIRLKPALS